MPRLNSEGVRDENTPGILLCVKLRASGRQFDGPDTHRSQEQTAGIHPRARNRWML